MRDYRSPEKDVERLRELVGQTIEFLVNYPGSYDMSPDPDGEMDILVDKLRAAYLETEPT